MTLKTRKPTGKPSWPITLIAGAEKAGKSWACAQASGSELIGRTLWLGIGEDDPDEYALIPGANFEIVEHEGTYRSILNALTAMVAEPHGEKPTLIVADSMTRLWELITSDVQVLANKRAQDKARKYNKPIPAEDVQITMDLWNIAKDRWDHIMDTLRAHRGPVLVTARLEEVTVLDDRGNPTKNKELKVKANKSLPYDVAGIVELPARGEAWLRGVRSVRMQVEKRTQLREFTVDNYWRGLGLHEVETSDRVHSGARAEGSEPEARPAVSSHAVPAARDWIAEVRSVKDTATLRSLYAEAKAAGAPGEVATAITVRAQELTQPVEEPPVDPEVDAEWLAGNAA